MAKPKVYDVAREQAGENIDRKIKILMDFAVNGIPWAASDDGAPLRNPDSGSRILDFVPVNEKQFSRWSSDAGRTDVLLNCEWTRKALVERFGAFTSHGVDTLKARLTDRERVNELFKTICIAAQDQIATDDPSSKLDVLQAEVDRLKAANESMGALVLAALDEKQERQRAIETVNRAFQSAKKAYADFEAEAQAELQRRDEQIAELRRQLREKLALVRR